MKKKSFVLIFLITVIMLVLITVITLTILNNSNNIEETGEAPEIYTEYKDEYKLDKIFQKTLDNNTTITINYNSEFDIADKEELENNIIIFNNENNNVWINLLNIKYNFDNFPAKEYIKEYDLENLISIKTQSFTFDNLTIEQFNYKYNDDMIVEDIISYYVLKQEDIITIFKVIYSNENILNNYSEKVLDILKSYNVYCNNDMVEYKKINNIKPVEYRCYNDLSEVEKEKYDDIVNSIKSGKKEYIVKNLSKEEYLKYMKAVQAVCDDAFYLNLEHYHIIRRRSEFCRLKT